MKKDASEHLAKDSRLALNKTVRTVARNIVNALADAGPEWSGDFKDSWAVYSAGTGAQGTGTFPYRLGDMPQLPTTKKDLGRKTRLIIENTAPHAPQAMDLEPGEFVFPGSEPKGEIVSRGIRKDTNIRGDIGPGTGNNRSTAPLDWYTTFVASDKMKRAVNKGINVVTREAQQGRFTEGDD
jgi:hypothetical protein